MKEYFNVLKNKNFTLLWAGQGVSNLGSKINFIGLTWLVIELTGKASAISLLFIFLIVPFIVFGPGAGVLVDRWNKKTVIVIADIIRGLIAFAMIFAKSLVFIYILAFIQTIFTLLFRPAIASAIPQIVKNKDELLTANALSMSTLHTASLIGPVLGGILIGSFGLRSAFFINGISFIFSALSEIWIKIPRSKMATSGNNKQDFLIQFKEGWSYIKSNSLIKFVIIYFVIASLSLGALPILNVVLIKEVFKLTPETYGLLMTINGSGLLLGAVAIGKWGKNIAEIKLIVTGVALYGATYIMLVLNPFILSVGICFFFIGVTTTVVDISYGTYLQKKVDPDKQGRVFSIDIAIGSVFSLIAMGSAGVLADAFGVVTIIICGGLFLVIQGLITMRLRIYRKIVKQ